MSTEDAAGNPMPDGPIDNPGLWRGADLERADDYAENMSSALITEVEAALEHAKRRGLEAGTFGRDDFPLPNAGAEIAHHLEELENGRGFVLIRGFPIDKYTEDEAAIIFWGLGCHFGQMISQNSYGHLLGHVRNLDLDIRQTNVRGYQTTVQLAYHNDQSDVIALLCRKTAKSGGQSSLVSVPAIFNEMWRQCPELVPELFQPFYIDRRGEFGREDEGDDPYYAMPILSYHKGLLTARYIRGYIMSAQRFPEVPRLTDKQIAAMDAFDEIAKSDGMALDFYMQPGDIQMANNYCVLHSRTSFEDHAELEDRRHMLRLWLCMPNSRELPPCFERRFGTCEGGALRGGIPQRRKAEEAPSEEFELERL